MHLSIKQLSKSYGSLEVLKEIDLDLCPGIYALLGPNGAGKSTLINVLTGNLHPNKGTVCLDEQNINELGQAYRSELGYMPQQQTLYEQFSAVRFLSYMAALKGMTKESASKEIERVLQIVNLSNEANRLLGQYSGGMKQRILIAQAIMNDPKVIILDEPTAGLDPKERIRIRNIISKIAGEKIIIFATHVVSDIEHIAKEVIILKEGKILKKASPLQLCKSLQGKVFELHIQENELEQIQTEYLVSNILWQEDGLLIRIISDKVPKNYYYQGVLANLEDVYLYHFNEKKG